MDEADKNKDGKIDFDEWEIMVKRIKQKIPLAESQLDKVKELFELYDSDADNSLSLNEIAVLLQEIGNKITALPAVSCHISSIILRVLNPMGCIDSASSLSAGQIPRKETQQTRQTTRRLDC